MLTHHSGSFYPPGPIIILHYDFSIFILSTPVATPWKLTAVQPATCLCASVQSLILIRDTEHYTSNFEILPICQDFM